MQNKKNTLIQEDSHKKHLSDFTLDNSDLELVNRQHAYQDD